MIRACRSQKTPMTWLLGPSHSHMLVESTPGVNFINILLLSFYARRSRKHKKYVLSSHQYLFFKTLVKVTFAYSPFRSFRRMRCPRTRYIKVVVLITLVTFILVQLIGSSGIGFGRRPSSTSGTKPVFQPEFDYNLCTRVGIHKTSYANL